ncbi:MAG: type II toxin-antitoxin system VapC family toxin [Campylobacterota bacterium]|nr:type II toxin-antitoxin system VapC family toxin [Campylobacterota bacterium]
MKYLVDSNIIIYYLEKNMVVYDFLVKHQNDCAISLITYYEVLNYDFNAEDESRVKAFLEQFEILNLSKNIIEKALNNRKNKKIKMADNFILATAQIFDLKIVTRNRKDFIFFTNGTINPFDE